MSARRLTFLTCPVNEASQECLIVKECGHKGAPPTIHQSFQRLIAAPTVETLDLKPFWEHLFLQKSRTLLS